MHDDASRPHSRMLAVIMLIAACGCAQTPSSPGTAGQIVPATQEPVLETSESQYSDRAVITVRLINTTARPLGYNLCRSKLERIVDGSWEVMHEMLAEFCTAELRTLPPGRAVTFSFRPLQAIRGRVRIRTELHDFYGRARLEAVSNLFEMRVSGD